MKCVYLQITGTGLSPCPFSPGMYFMFQGHFLRGISLDLLSPADLVTSHFS